MKKNTDFPTLSRLENHAQLIISKGPPFKNEDLKVLNIWNKLKGGKAGNAGKRNRRAENARQIKDNK